MIQNKKTKLCWNCEGSVARDVIHCSYCGVYLKRDEDEDLQFEQNTEESYKPSYNPASSDQEEVPPPPYQATKQAVEAIPSAPSSVDWKAVVFPLFLLLSGSFFLFFGLLLTFFSENGLLTLQWDSSYWFVYFTLSMPLLYFGWRTLGQLPEYDSHMEATDLK